MSFGIHAQQLQLVPSTKQPSAAFAYSISHTDEWLVAGAKDDTTQAGRTGAAYFFKYENNAWVEKQKVKPDIGADGDFFGISVAIYGDYAIVGANGDDTQGVNAGAAFIYRRDDDKWVIKQKLLPHKGSGFDEYGIAVAMEEELIVVGAYSDAENGPFSGAAYIYSLTDDNWSEKEKILPEDGAADDKFGRSVDTDGEKVIVCGVLNDDMAEDSGSAYIFSRTGNTWYQEAKLLPPDGAANDRFGRSVGIDNDYVAIGSVLDDDNGSSSGSVYVFRDEADGWNYQDKLTPMVGQADDFFGYSLSLAGRYLVVGAHNDDDFGMKSGSAYLFTRIGQDWTQTEKFNADNAREGDNYGESVSIDDAWISIGAPFYSTGNGMTGAAFTTPAPEVLGLIEDQLQLISVYPNPVSKSFNLNLPKTSSTGLSITILDARGNNLIKMFHSIDYSSTTISVDVSSLASGLYISVINSCGNTFVSKFYED